MSQLNADFEIGNPSKLNSEGLISVRLYNEQGNSPHSKEILVIFANLHGYGTVRKHGLMVGKDGEKNHLERSVPEERQPRLQWCSTVISRGRMRSTSQSRWG